MKQFSHKKIEKKIIESKKKLRTLSSDYKNNFINIEKKISVEVKKESSIEDDVKEIVKHDTPIYVALDPDMEKKALKREKLI